MTIKRTAMEVLEKHRNQMFSFIDTHKKIRDKIDHLYLFKEKALICQINTWRCEGNSDSEIVSKLQVVDPMYLCWQPYNVEDFLEDVKNEPGFAHLFYDAYETPLENLQNAVNELNKYNKGAVFEYKIIPQSDKSLIMGFGVIVAGEWRDFRTIFHYNEDEYMEMFNSIMNMAYTFRG